MYYVVHGKLICHGLSNSFVIGNNYTIKVFEEDNNFKVVEIPYSDYYSLDKLNIYFKIYLSKEDLLAILQNKLSITDEDIVEYVEGGNLNIICIKYKHDLLYLKLHDNFENRYTKMRVEITSNNLARQKTFDIALFKDDINKFCDLLKLMQK